MLSTFNLAADFTVSILASGVRLFTIVDLPSRLGCTHVVLPRRISRIGQCFLLPAGYNRHLAAAGPDRACKKFSLLTLPLADPYYINTPDHAEVIPVRLRIEIQPGCLFINLA